MCREGTEDGDSQGDGSSQPDTISIASRTSQNTVDSDKVGEAHKQESLCKPKDVKVLNPGTVYWIHWPAAQLSSSKNQTQQLPAVCGSHNVPVIRCMLQLIETHHMVPDELMTRSCLTATGFPMHLQWAGTGAVHVPVSDGLCTFAGPAAFSEQKHVVLCCVVHAAMTSHGQRSSRR